MRAIALFLAVLVFAGLSFSIPVTGCMAITSGGTYNLTANLSGANQSSPDFSTFGGTAMSCIKITASNVVLDCGGNRLVGPGTPPYPFTVGIFANGSSSNAIIKNCNISGYSEGIATKDSSGHNITFNTISGNGWAQSDGIYVTNGVDYLIANNSVRNAYSGILVGYASTQRASVFDNNATNCSGAGIYLYQLSYSNVRNNRVNDSYRGLLFYSNYRVNGSFNYASNNTFGIMVDFPSGENFIANSTAQESGEADFDVDPNVYPDKCNAVLVQNLTGSGGRPIYYYNSTISLSNLEVAQLLLCNSNNSVLNNVTIHGSDSRLNNFLSVSFSNNVVVRNSNSSTNNIGFSAYESNNFTIVNCTASTNANDGFMVGYGIGDTIANNTAFNNTDYGFQISCSNSSFTNNTASFNNLGFFAWNSYHNFTLNRAFSNVGPGFQLNSIGHVMVNNTAYNNTAGFMTNYGNNIIFTNNTAYNNTYGFNITLTSGNVFRNNSAMGNEYGIHLFNCTNESLGGDTASNNSQDGIKISGSNATLSNVHLYNNTYDFEPISIFGSLASVNLTSVIFDRPAGDYANYTNVSLNDSLAAFTSFTMTWSQSPGSPPIKSFLGKYLNITPSGSNPIDIISWSWLDSELTGFNESKFQLWKYNASGWGSGPLNSTPDVSANTLRLANMDPASVYAILENSTPNCPIVTSSYTMANNFVGAPNNIDFSNNACVLITASNVVFDCNGFNITDNNPGVDRHAIFVNSSNNVTIRNCPRITNYSGSGAYFRYSNNGSIRNISIVNSSATGYGIQLEGSSNNTISDNIVNNVSQSSLWIRDGSNWNVVRNNSMDLSSVDGMTLINSNHTLITNSTACNHGWSGFAVQDATNTTFINDTACGNGIYGFYYIISGSTLMNSSVDNVTSYGNDKGLEVAGRLSLNLSRIHMFSNGRDFDTATYGTGTSALNLSDMIFDRPAGDMQNFTNLTIVDTVETSTGYFINWTMNTSAAPGNSKSFLGKFVNITNTTPSVSIDSISWRWTDSEATAPFSEGNFQLWRYNSSGWGSSALNSTPNLAQNSLSQFNMNPASGYGILDVVTNCPVISTPFTAYTQSANFTGAPNNASPISSTVACVKINASNVVYDCNGYYIKNNGTGTTPKGILVINNVSNVTIRNCPGVSGYSDGIEFFNVTNGSVSNSTAFNNSFAGFTFLSDSNITAANNTAYNNSNSAFYLSSASNGAFINNTANGSLGFSILASSNNTFTRNTAFGGSTSYGFDIEQGSNNNTLVNNTAYSNYYGFVVVTNSNLNSLINNTAYSNTYYGFEIVNSCYNNTLFNNVAYNHTLAGFYIGNLAISNNITNNTAYNNTQYGFEISSGSNNILANNTAYLNQNGFYSESSTVNSLIANTAHNNTQNGFYIYTVTNHTLANNTAYNNTQRGFYLYASSNNTLANNTANKSSSGFSLTASSLGNLLINNIAYNLSGDAFSINSNSNGTTMRDNRAYNNSGSGFSANGFNNTFINNSASNNTQYGFSIYSSINDTLANNTAFNNPSGGYYVWLNSANITLIGNNATYTVNGFYINNDGVRLSNNTASGNTYGLFVVNFNGSSFIGDTLYNNTNGIYVTGATNSNFTGEHMYNNTYDFRANGAAGPFNMTNMIFDNPAGNYQNFTNLSLNDNVTGTELYSIKWTRNSSALQSGFVSFNQKFVNISSSAGAPSIDSIVWNWQASEVGSFNESRLRLMKYNTSWTILNSTADTGAHTFTLKNLLPGSDYGILQDNDTSAPKVNLNGPANGAIFNITSVAFNFTAVDDASASMNCSIYIDNILNWTNSSTANNTATIFSISGIAAGVHSWNVSCIDSSNNTGANTSRSFTIDQVAPQLSIQSPQNNSYVTGSVPLNFTVSDNVGVGSCWYYLDLAGPTALPGCSNTTLSGLSQGQHNVTVFANDTAGNTNRSTVLFTIGCPVITASGTYTMNLNYAGAPNSAAPFSGSACVVIAAQNVVFDCAGFSITNNLAGMTYGMLVNGSFTNVTIRNCPSVSNYTYGIYLLNSTGSALRNITSNNNTAADFASSNSNGSIYDGCIAYNSPDCFDISGFNATLTNNTAYGCSGNGVLLFGGAGNHTLSNNTAYNDGYAFTLFTGNNTLANNTAYNSQIGFRIPGGPNDRNTLRNNTARNNSLYGFLVVTTLNTLSNNTAVNNTEGFYVLGSNNAFSSNAAYNNTYGFHMDTSSGNNLTGNTASNNSLYGIYLYRASNSSISNNTANNNAQAGVLLFFNSANNTISGNNATSNGGYGFRLDSSNGNSLISNTARGSTNGFFSDSNSSNFTGNSAYNNPNGFYLTNAVGNRLVNNLVNNSTTMGYELTVSANNYLSGNNATWCLRGFSIDGGSGNNLTGNSVSHSNADGITLSGTTGNLLAYNNVTTSSAGFYLSGSSTFNRLINNTASANVQYGYELNGAFTSNNLLSYNNASGNTIYGFFLTNAAGDNLTYNNASGNPIGIYVLGGSSNVLIANNASGNSNNGIQAVSSPSLIVVNNTVSYDSGFDALYLINSSGSTVTGNYAHDNSNNGISVDNSTGVLISLNSAWNNGESGIRTEYTNSSLVTGNTAYLNARSGVNVREGMLDNVTGNTVYNNSQIGVFLHSTDDSRVLSNRAYYNTVGVFINDSSGNLIQGNSVNHSVYADFGSNNSDGNLFVGNNASNTLYGFYLENSNNSNITGSLAHDFTDLNDGGGNPDITTGGRAVYLSQGSNNNLVEGNVLYNSSIFGVDVVSSNYTSARNNTIYGIGQVGLAALNAWQTSFERNDVRRCYLAGVVIEDCRYTNVTSNILSDNLFGGAYMESSGWNRFENNTISNNVIGLMHENSNATTMSGDHLYNNSLADFVQNTTLSFPGLSINLSGVVFDRPAGDFTNYTNLSLDDALPPEAYSISWSAQPSSTPERSFAGKFIQISNLTPAVSIDNVTWRWNNAELVGPPAYTEADFALFKYSGSWAAVPGTVLSTSANTLSKANLNPASVYAILDVATPSSHEPEPTLPTLSVALSSTCEGNTITVQSGSADISGADVLVDNAENLNDLGSGTTDGDGQLRFTGCDLRVRIRVTADGYQTLEVTKNTIACEQCVECVTDNNCPDNKVCSNQHCIGFSCGCGYPENHRCASYQCCSDTDCKANLTCVAHACKVPEVTYECYADKDCKDSQSCDIKSGDKGGKCKEITGCGEVKNHALNPYQCGTAPGCPSCGYGQTCVDTMCKTYGLKGPNTGFIGDSNKVQAVEDNKSCINCDLRITDPTGTVLTGKTDSLGNFTLPLKTMGTYKVALLKNGTVVRTIEIRALPKAPIEETTPQTAMGGELAGGAVFLVIGLLALVVAGIILMRRGKGGKPKEPSKEAKPQGSP